jgi:hypothetical protein
MTAGGVWLFGAFLRLSAQARGFSTTEIATVLSATTLLTTAAAPSIEGYVSLAQDVRAQHDVRTLAVSILRLRMDVASQTRAPNGLATFTLLVGDGERPHVSTGTASAWELPLTSPDVDALANHLVTNGPSYRRLPISMGGGWRGPYLDSGVIRPDPWGHRYAVNVKGLRDRSFAVIVLSAGPNGVIETPFTLTPGMPTGDDVYALVARGR